MGRYEKNGIFSEADRKRIQKAKVHVIGCGGLGGYVVEMLARVGVGCIQVVDGDAFVESNLNRQLISDTTNLGQFKVMEAQKRIQSVNPEIEFRPIPEFLNEQNAHDLIRDADVVVDALDRIHARKVLQNACEALAIPLVHGAIAGWYGQVTTIFPGDRTLDRLYPDGRDQGVESQLGNPSFTPALVASMEVSEVLKILTDQGNCLKNKMLYIDLLENEFSILEI